MADIVHYRLEKTFPELEDLEKRAIFTRSEIREIVKTRRNFEYKVKRPSPLKEDFLEFIEYEKQVDRLRRLRKKAIGNGDKKRKKSSVSDLAGVRRVIDLYRMATSRFKGDIELWFQYLEYSNSFVFSDNSFYSNCKKALAEVMRFHPKVPAVWVYAAAWAYDHDLNFESALSLMQSGLRACRNSEDLWVECVRLILTHLNKLKTRKIMLGEDNSTLVVDNKLNEEKKWRDENEDLFMSLDDESGANVQNKDHDKWDTLCVTVLQETYREAVKALPSSFSLRKRFLEIVEATNLGHLEGVRTEILDDMQKDFSGGPDYWVWRATLKLTDPQTTLDISKEEGRLQADEVIKVYEEAIDILPSAVMFEKYINFLIEIINLKGEEKQNAEVSGVSDHTDAYVSHIVRVFTKAEALGCLNDDLVCLYIKFYLNMDKTDEALKLAENFCEGIFADAKQLWVLRVTEHMKCATKSGTISKDAISSVFNLFKKMLKNIAVYDDENLWFKALDFFAKNKKYFGKLLDLCINLLTKDGGTDNGFSLPATLVKFVCEKEGIHKARELYKRQSSPVHLESYTHFILSGITAYLSLHMTPYPCHRKPLRKQSNVTVAVTVAVFSSHIVPQTAKKVSDIGSLITLPHPGLGLYKHCLELEFSIDDEESVANARKLFECALTTYSQDISLWRDYYSMEMKTGTSETSSAVYWRTKKTLGDASALSASIIA
ncbi:hypothetical protein KSS87_007267 [Heliosperma pusillum]|nr:hypothetical protein KSS87_007267 [Heliosperma pusillum]